jgi:hypothetical protein
MIAEAIALILAADPSVIVTMVAGGVLGWHLSGRRA